MLKFSFVLILLITSGCSTNRKPASNDVAAVDSQDKISFEEYQDFILWKECSDPVIKGNMTGYKCSRKGRKISKTFKTFLDKTVPVCIEAALVDETGSRQIKGIDIRHTGLEHSNPIKHQPTLFRYGRVIKVQAFIVTFDDGTSKIVSPFNNKDTYSFEKFNRCFDEKVIEHDSECYYRKRYMSSNHIASVFVRHPISFSSSSMSYRLPFCSTSYPSDLRRLR